MVFEEHFPDQQLLAYWEGLENTVSVGSDADGIQTLFTNSRGQTNDAPDLVRYHRMMGHLAALLAPSATPRALVVGLGAGATPGAIAQHAGSQVDVIELSEAVIAAAPYFRTANADVLHQPNVHLAVDDGRNFLLRNREPYDVDGRRPSIRRWLDQPVVPVEYQTRRAVAEARRHQGPVSLARSAFGGR